jgi:hypothetical protein
MWLGIFGITGLNHGNMDETITAIDSIALRIPLDISAPAPTSQGVPRTDVESLYVRVTTSGGVAGWGDRLAPPGSRRGPGRRSDSAVQSVSTISLKNQASKKRGQVQNLPLP